MGGLEESRSIRDQVAHTVGGVVVMLPVAAFGTPAILCALSAAIFGAIREWEQHRLDPGPEPWWWGAGRWVDVAFWTLGGFLAGRLL